ncbi:MAG: ADOP family duplicated permease [Gemmatimonadetes bacterium]|nr:ADOP family duplicated permease [Gemmatimonadota bacterium]
MGRWLDRVLGREDVRAEVEREIRFHLEMRKREYEEAGYASEEARAAAERAFGDAAEIMDRLRAARARRQRRLQLGEVMAMAVSECRQAIRSLRKRPGFVAVLVLTLGVGIGLSVATVGVLSAYLARALPYPDADRLVFVQGAGAPDWQDPPAVLSRVVSWDLDALSIVSGGTPEQVRTSWVSPAFFEMMGVRPVLGRVFGEEEAGPGGASVAVIHHALWQRRWGGDPGVIGRTFTAYSIDRPEEAEVFTIIGVLPEDFWYFNGYTEVIAPLRTPRPVYMATLAPGVTLTAARQALESAARERRAERIDLNVIPVHEQYVSNVRPTLLAVAAAVALVLLIACANAAVLLVVRTAGRRREFAVRAALGAGRVQLGRQLLLEGLTVSVIAAMAGTALAWVLLETVGVFLPRMLGAEAPGGAAALRVDGLALLAAVAITTVTGVLFGMIPLVTARPGRMARALAEGGRGTESLTRQRLRSTLVVAELALSLALLAGAGLLVRSAVHLGRLELGFDAENIAIIGFSLRAADWSDPVDRVGLYERIAERVRTQLPGTSAAVVTRPPFSQLPPVPVETPEVPAPDSGGPRALLQMASPGYFETIGIRVVRGSGFDATHGPSSPPVALVSDELAARLWPGADPIGQRIRVPMPTLLPAVMGSMSMQASRAPAWRTVIGVVTEVRQGLTEAHLPDLYYPLAQVPPMAATLMVRDPTGRGRLGAIRDAVWQVIPELPLNELSWMEDDVAFASLPSRFLALLISGFALFAVILATLGLYGVISYAVSQRRRDIAIRMALGAESRSVVRMFVAQGARLAGIGVLIGVTGGLALSAGFKNQLYGVESNDPATYALVALVLAAAALGATWLPARRATREDPVQLLHAD